MNIKESAKETLKNPSVQIGFTVGAATFIAASTVLMPFSGVLIGGFLAAAAGFFTGAFLGSSHADGNENTITNLAKKFLEKTGIREPDIQLGDLTIGEENPPGLVIDSRGLDITDGVPAVPMPIKGDKQREEVIFLETPDNNQPGTGVLHVVDETGRREVSSVNGGEGEVRSANLR